MKQATVIALAAMLICGCQREDGTPKEIWRGGGAPLNDVQTLAGFSITPQMAVSNGFQQLGPSKQVPVLWADDSNYYFTYGFGKDALQKAVTIQGKEGTEPGH